MLMTHKHPTLSTHLGTHTHTKRCIPKHQNNEHSSNEGPGKQQKTPHSLGEKEQ